jgi:hypothetical protein
MKNLTWTGLLLTATISLAFAPACSGSDTTAGDGDTSGDGDSSAGDGDTSSTGGAGTGGAGVGTGGAGVGTGGAGVGTGGAGVGTGGAGVGTGGADVGTGGGAATGGSGNEASAECTTYCTMWFAKNCNSAVEGNNVYADEAACLTACDAFATNVADCRQIHLGYVSTADDHCGHAAATPTDNCEP